MSLILSNICFAGDIVDQNKGEIINDIIPSRITLINNIISNPEAASMKNLGILASPHNEDEISFYVNSMTDGTKSAYEKLSDNLESHLEKIKSKSSSEKSVLLQYLRLSLLAYNKGYGSKAPIIKITNVEQSQLHNYEFIVEGIFLVNSAGKQIELPAKLTFYTDYSAFALDKSVYLGEIIVNNNILYGR